MLLAHKQKTNSPGLDSARGNSAAQPDFTGRGASSEALVLLSATKRAAGTCKVYQPVSFLQGPVLRQALSIEPGAENVQTANLFVAFGSPC